MLTFLFLYFVVGLSVMLYKALAKNKYVYTALLHGVLWGWDFGKWIVKKINIMIQPS